MHQFCGRRSTLREDALLASLLPSKYDRRRTNRDPPAARAWRFTVRRPRQDVRRTNDHARQVPPHKPLASSAPRRLRRSPAPSLAGSAARQLRRSPAPPLASSAARGILCTETRTNVNG